jgi:hypothetical protein
MACCWSRLGVELTFMNSNLEDRLAKLEQRVQDLGTHSTTLEKSMVKREQFFNYAQTNIRMVLGALIKAAADISAEEKDRLKLAIGQLFTPIERLHASQPKSAR